jgi:MFS family permease
VTTHAAPRLLSRDFLIVAASTLLFFAAFAMSIPVLPRYIVEELGQSEAVVGLVFGANALAAVLVRPMIGRIGDRHSRRVLLVGGSVLTAVGMLAHVVADTVTLLVAARLITGAGQAAVMVAATTIALDLAPTTRRGEASSYIMVALQLGLGTGPLLGEFILSRASYDAVWVASAVGALVCLVTALGLRREPRRSAPTVRAKLIHPAGVRPGVVLGIGAIGFIGYLAFVPLFGQQIGLAQVGPLFLLCSGTIAVVRTLAARVPDRLGPVPGASVALALMALGLLGMAAWRTPVGLYTTTFVMAAGSALLFPSLMLAATSTVPESERARAMATFTVFIDVTGAVGPSVLGLLVVVGGFPGAFAAAGGAALLALALLRGWLAPWLAHEQATLASHDGSIERAHRGESEPGG